MHHFTLQHACTCLRIRLLAGTAIISMDMYNDASRLIDSNFDGEISSRKPPEQNRPDSWVDLCSAVVVPPSLQIPA